MQAGNAGIAGIAGYSSSCTSHLAVARTVNCWSAGLCSRITGYGNVCTDHGAFKLVSSCWRHWRMVHIVTSVCMPCLFEGSPASICLSTGCGSRGHLRLEIEVTRQAGLVHV